MPDASFLSTGIGNLSPYRRLALAGFLVMGMAFLLITVVVQLYFAAGLLGLSLIMAWLVWRFGRWAVLLAAILGIVLAPFSLLLSLFSLQSQGNIPIGHTLLVLLIAVGVIMFLVGGIGAFVRERRTARSAGTG